MDPTNVFIFVFGHTQVFLLGIGCFSWDLKRREEKRREEKSKFYNEEGSENNLNNGWGIFILDSF